MHPITRGIDDFHLDTEQYWVLSDGYNDVLATVTQEARAFDAWNRAGDLPAIWTRQWGDGRVFVCTPGHELDVLRNPDVRMIIERGLLWAARDPYAGGMSKHKSRATSTSRPVSGGTTTRPARSKRVRSRSASTATARSPRARRPQRAPEIFAERAREWNAEGDD